MIETQGQEGGGRGGRKKRGESGRRAHSGPMMAYVAAGGGGGCSIEANADGVERRRFHQGFSDCGEKGI